MTTENKKGETSGWEMVGDLLLLSIDAWPLFAIILAIALMFLIFKAIMWLINLFLSEKKSLPKIKSIKPESMHFHVISKKKIIKILGIDFLLILVLICTLAPSITLNTLYFIITAIFVVTLLSMITCDMHATINADKDRFYICYDYLFYKKKVKEIRFKRIKKMTIIDDKIKIITKFRRYLLTVEPDSEAYNYFLKLKQTLDA